MTNMTELLDGFTPFRAEDAEKYKRLRWWGGLTFGDILDRAADRYPDKEAFVDGASRLTFAQARDRVNRLAIGLINLGIEPTERVLVQLPNWNEFVTVYFALQKIGAIDVLLIDRYRPYEINHLIRLSGATTWVSALEIQKDGLFAHHQRGAERKPPNEKCHRCKRRRSKGLSQPGGFDRERETDGEEHGRTGSKATGSDAGVSYGPHRRDHGVAEGRSPHPQ